MPLFTNFLPGKDPGIFDWYTTLVGLFTLGLLAGHGALFLVWRTTGPVQERSRLVARRVWRVVVPLWVVVTLATAWIQPDIFANLLARPWSIVLVADHAGRNLGGLQVPERRARTGGVSVLGGFHRRPAWQPRWRATIPSGCGRRSIHRTASPRRTPPSASYGLQIALLWFAVGITLAVGYFVNLFRSIRGKVGEDADGHGY